MPEESPDRIVRDTAFDIANWIVRQKELGVNLDDVQPKMLKMCPIWEGRIRERGVPEVAASVMLVVAVNMAMAALKGAVDEFYEEQKAKVAMGN